MERYEMINKALKPLDLALDLGIGAIKKAKLYEPLQNGVQDIARTIVTRTFEKNHSLEIIGTENIPEEGGVIFAANHQSWQDAQVLGISSPRFVQFIAKAEFLEWPVLRQFFDFMQAVYIKRTGDSDGLSSIADAIRDGSAIGIFPEGTIPGEEDVPRWDVERETGLLRGRTGVARLALMTGAPVVPVGISGTGAAFPPEMFPRLEQAPFANKVPITIRFGEPITFGKKDLSKVSRLDLRKKTDKVMRAITELVDHSRDYVPITLPLPERRASVPVPPMPYRNSESIEAKTGVLVLHGFTGNIHTVDELVPYLEAHKVPFRFPYLRGHGTVWEDLKGTTSQDWFEDAEAAMIDLLQECEKVVIVGLSMGGAVGLQLAAKHNDVVDSICVVAPALRFADPMSVFSPVMAKVFKSWPGPKSYNDKEHEKLHNKNYERFATDSFASLYAYTTEVTNDLSFVRAPLLVVAAKKDTVISPRAASLVYEKASSKQKEIAWFEKSGHEMLLDMEKDAVCARIDEFISKRLSGAS